MMLIYDHDVSEFILLNEDKEVQETYYYRRKYITLPFSNEVEYMRECVDDEGEYTGDFEESLATIIPLNAVNSIRLVGNEAAQIAFEYWLKGIGIKDVPQFFDIGERHELMEFCARR